MDRLLIQGMCFVSVVLLVLGIERIYRARTSGRPMLETGTGKPGVFTWFQGPIEVLGGLLLPTMMALSPAREALIRRTLVTGGVDESISPLHILGAQAFTALCGIGICLLMPLLGGGEWGWMLLGGAIVGFVGWMYPWLWLQRQAADRKLMISKQLPYALDLLTTAVEAGQDFGAAVRYITRNGLTGPLGEEFDRVLSEIDLGNSRQVALRKMAERTDTDESAQFASAVIQSIETGSSLSSTLRMQAQDLRRCRFNRAEQQAAKAPSLMIIPMALFIVPGIFIIVFTPVIIKVMRSLGKM
ncbi:MAG TPA: hypothetical protein DCS43_05115 [Verrucomicrobia bacterium]|nr:hypothetical protein [Verrucomicrobiota bacterium]